MEEHIPLSQITTFKIGGPARYFSCVKTLDDLKQAVVFAKKENLPFFILGGGSNLLVSDEGFKGVIIKNELLGKVFHKEEKGEVLAEISAGENWDEFVSECVGRGLYGVENLSGIPGTVGAAPVQNIGAYGSEAKDVIVSVEALNSETGQTRIFSNKECGFAYRDSFFKSTEGKKFIITQVSFRLQKNSSLNLGYKDIKKYFEESRVTPTLQTLREAVLKIRADKFPDLKITGTAGSFFKNPIISKEHFDRLKQKYPDLPGFPLDPSPSTPNAVKVPLAWILDNILGIKGHMVGNVGLHHAQPLVVINQGGGKAVEVLDLVKKVTLQIKDKTDIDVVWEVEML